MPDLLLHQLEIPLNGSTPIKSTPTQAEGASCDSPAPTPNRDHVHEAQVLGVLGKHGREHAWDNVAKIGIPSVL
jgi:hypothetical protein